MAVNLPPPDPAQLHPVPGVELCVAMAGIRKPDRKDLLVVRLAPGAAVAGVFTRNRFCAAPVLLAKRHLKNSVRALVVNTGNANAGTGQDGIDRALAVCAWVAKSSDCKPDQVLPFSTGVIMEPLPVERITAASLRNAGWLDAAEAIMTTDTVPKVVSRKVRLSGGEAVVTGIAKGSGMIRPGMATMLAFVATDAKVGRGKLSGIVKRVAEQTFNCVTVDGDTSTNDSFVLISTGSAPKSAHGVDARRAPGGNVAREGRDPHEKDGNAGEGDGIHRAHAEEEAREQRAQNKRRREPQKDPGAHLPEPLGEDVVADSRRPRPERHPHTKLARSLAHRVRDDAVETDHRHDQSEKSEAAGQRCPQPQRAERQAVPQVLVDVEHFVRRHLAIQRFLHGQIDRGHAAHAERPHNAITRYVHRFSHNGFGRHTSPSSNLGPSGPQPASRRPRMRPTP